MPISQDVRQAVILALEAQGGDAFTTLAAQLKELQDLQAVLDAQREQSTISANKYVGATNQVQAAIVKNTAATRAASESSQEWLDLQAKLQQMTQDTAAADERASKATTDARERGTKAVQDFAAAVRQAVAAEDREHDELDKLNKGFIQNAQNVGQATRATREQVQALKDMGIIQDSVNTKMAGATKSTGGYASAADAAADKQKKMGQAALGASYLIQDAQYGVGAMANNFGILSQQIGNASPWLTRVTASIGGPAGLGAGIMLAAVAGDLLYHNWHFLASALGSGIPPKALNDLKAIEEQLKKITDKGWKTAIDMMDIDILQKKTEKLTETEAAYQRLKSGKTEAQQKRAQLFTEAVTEGGGANDYSGGEANINAALKQLTPVVLEPAAVELKAFIARLKQTIPLDATENHATVRLARHMQEQYDREAVPATTARDKGIVDLLGDAAKGNEGARAKIEAMMNANPQAFADRGVDTLRFGAGLQMASPKELFAPEREKEAKESRDKAEAEFSAIDDVAIQNEDDALKRNKDRRTEFRKRQRQSLTEQAITDKDINDKRKARDAQTERMRFAENEAAEGVNASNLGTLKADARAEAKTGRATAKANRMNENTGAKEGAGYVPQIQGALAQNALAGGNNDVYARQIEQQVGQSFFQQGHNPEEARAMAYGLVRKAVEEFNAQVAKNIQATGDMASGLQATFQDAVADQQRIWQQIQATNAKLNQGAQWQGRARNSRGTQQAYLP